MENQQKLKNVNLTEKEVKVLLTAIYDSLWTEEDLQSSILEDLQELLSYKEREKLHKMLTDSKERTKTLEELKEKVIVCLGSCNYEKTL